MDSGNPLAPVERWLVATLATLEPSNRKALLREIGRELRKRNQRRISRQIGPDGTPWPARKRDSAGRVRKTAKMLQGLREIRRLALTVRPDGIELGYSGRSARLAAIHHYGEVAPVEPGGPIVKYAARPVLGLDPADIDFVRDRIMNALKGGE
jgi:phage virion morphogenesis protein